MSPQQHHIQRLQRRYVLASLLLAASGVVEFALSQAGGALFAWASAPVVVVAVCAVVIHRSAVLMERGGQTPARLSKPTWEYTPREWVDYYAGAADCLLAEAPNRSGDQATEYRRIASRFAQRARAWARSARHQERASNTTASTEETEMAYGTGYTRKQLKAFAKQAAADTTAYVVEAPGVRVRVTGRQSADAVAARYEGAVIRKA